MSASVKVSATLLRLGLGIDPKHQYSKKYLDAQQRRLERITRNSAVDKAIDGSSFYCIDNACRVLTR
jgi:hypothetical protein